jgi:hypothetical protein
MGIPQLGNTMNNKVQREHIDKRTKIEPTIIISINPSILREVAPFIVDLITIYDSDKEEVDTVVPILNEAVKGMLDTQFPQGQQPLDIETCMNTNEGHITSSDQTSQPLDKGEGCNKGQEEPKYREKIKTPGDKYEDGNGTDIVKNETEGNRGEKGTTMLRRIRG